MLGKLAGLAVPPWVRVVVPLALVAAIFAGGMWLQKKITAGKVAKLEGEVALLEYAVEDRNGTIAAMATAAEAVTATLAANATAQANAERALAEYLAKPPRTITRWRDRAAEVPDAIPTDAPCTVQVHTGFSILQAAVRERGTP
jgi:hypothetical protein